MKNKSDDRYSAAETARRVKAAVLGAFKTSPASLKHPPERQPTAKRKRRAKK